MTRPNLATPEGRELGRQTHPLAFPASRSGACGMVAGDRVVYAIDGRHGVTDEFLHDGDALVTFDDGAFETVKWNHLSRETVEAPWDHVPGGDVA